MWGNERFTNYDVGCHNRTALGKHMTGFAGD